MIDPRAIPLPPRLTKQDCQKLQTVSPIHPVTKQQHQAGTIWRARGAEVWRFVKPCGRTSARTHRGNPSSNRASKQTPLQRVPLPLWDESCSSGETVIIQFVLGKTLDLLAPALLEGKALEETSRTSSFPLEYLTNFYSLSGMKYFFFTI